MTYQLAFLDGSLKGTRRRIQRRQVTVGSDLSCEIWLAEEGVGGRHARFEVRDGGVFARALEADGRIRVGGIDATEARLSDGDVVEIGSIRVRYEGARHIQVRQAVRGILIAAGLAAAAFPAVRYLRRRVSEAVPPPGDEQALPVLGAPEPAPPAGVPPGLEAKQTAMDRPEPLTPAPDGTVTNAGAALPEAAGSTNGLDVALHNRLEEIRMTIHEGRLKEADEALTVMGREMPGCLPVFIERARLLEQMRRLPEAERHWAYVLEKSSAGPLYELAANELSRMASEQIGDMPPPVPAIRVEEPVAPPPAPKIALVRPDLDPPPPDPSPSIRRPVESPPVAPAAPPPVARAPAPRPAVTPSIPGPAAVPTAPGSAAAAAKPSVTAAPVAAVSRKPAPRIARPAPVVKIVNVEQRRFPASPEYEDMRLLRISLAPQPGTDWLRLERITLAVEFFDRKDDAGAPLPTGAVVPRDPIRLPEGSWKDGAERTITATYTVPAGANDAASGLRYYGYRIRVYYDGILQADLSKPDALKNR